MDACTSFLRPQKLGFQAYLRQSNESETQRPLSSTLWYTSMFLISLCKLIELEMIWYNIWYNILVQNIGTTLEHWYNIHHMYCIEMYNVQRNWKFYKFWHLTKTLNIYPTIILCVLIFLYCYFHFHWKIQTKSRLLQLFPQIYGKYSSNQTKLKSNQYSSNQIQDESYNILLLYFSTFYLKILLEHFTLVLQHFTLVLVLVLVLVRATNCTGLTIDKYKYTILEKFKF